MEIHAGYIEITRKSARFVRGGSGSGNFGHEGRPGEVGGSGDGGSGEIERAPDNLEGIDQRRIEAEKRIQQWQDNGQSKEEILYNGYKWRQSAHDHNQAWDWAVWEQIQKFAQEEGFEYKQKLTDDDVWNNPKIPMDVLKSRGELNGDQEQAANDYRNKNNAIAMTRFLKTQEGEQFQKITLRQLWGAVVKNGNKDVGPPSSGLQSIGRYKPYPGLQDLVKAKTFEEALATPVTIYRGVGKDYNEEGVKKTISSFTTAPAIAKGFAEGYMAGVHQPGTGKVIEMTIPFGQLKGAIDQYGEHEVLVNTGKKWKSEGSDSSDNDWLEFLHSFQLKDPDKDEDSP